MRILFLTSAHNSLSQRLWIELRDHGHDIAVCVAASRQEMIEAASRHAPDLIVAPMLKTAVPEEVWSRHLCLIVHPGIRGDRGPSSLDWAIAKGERHWGVTILQAAAGFDEGPIWSAQEFLCSTEKPKSSLYRGEVTEAAVRGVLEAVERVASGRWQPETLTYVRPYVLGCLRPPMQQRHRTIDWTRDPSAAIIRRIRAADSAPGVLGTLFGRHCFFYGAHEEDRLKGPPGQILATRDGAICIGTVDGAVWISHLRARDPDDWYETDCLEAVRTGCAACEPEQCSVAGIKLPAAQVLGPLLRGVAELTLPPDAARDCRTYREIVYEEAADIGYLSFEFYNGAMSTDQCRRLREAFLQARMRPTRVIVLLGGRDFWSNGIHLNTIEASADPAEESWRNINAIDDLVAEILTTQSHLVVSGLRGNAGAGGAMLALAADHVYARRGVVLNPHYKSMGNLYGSEYWTYTLPRRVGRERALDLTESCLPMGTREAVEIGFLDDAFGETVADFEAELGPRVRCLAGDWRRRLREKQERRLEDEAAKPLSAYRNEELARMRVNFFGSDPAYHEARRKFVFKGAAPGAGRPEPRASADCAPPERLGHGPARVDAEIRTLAIARQ
jgi:putative two-component system protein, hydrogenase maturation factor HypX/HoxX